MSDSPILIVEDNEDYREGLMMTFQDKGFRVCAVSTFEDALKELSQRIFQVALVDIMLNEDPDNRDGIKVLDAIANLNEGTRPIVLSGQRSRSLAAGLVSKHGARAYLDKGEIMDNTDLAVQAVREELEKVELRRYGKARDALAFFEALDPSWVSNMLTYLSPKGGFANLAKFLTEFCDPLAPLLLLNERAPIRVDRSLKIGIGEVWSKGLGQPIRFFICRSSSMDAVSKGLASQGWDLNKPLTQCSHFSELIGVVCPLPDVGFQDVARP